MKYEELKKKDPIWKGGWLSVGIAVFQNISESEKRNVERVMKDLEIETPNNLMIELEEWIYLSQCIYHQFQDLLPRELVEKIKNCIMPITVCRNGNADREYLKFLVKGVALKLIEKLKRSYFEENVPVILSISLATLPDHLSTVAVMINVDGIQDLLIDELSNIINNGKYSQNEIKKFSENIKYLYAIIIDTSWYNWFPEIVEKEFSIEAYVSTAKLVTYCYHLENNDQERKIL